MISADTLEKRIIKLKKKEIIEFLMRKRFIHKEMDCSSCSITMKLRKSKRHKDHYAWRCLNKECIKFKNYISLRKNSFFSNFNCKFKLILRVLIKFLVKEQEFTILEYFKSK